MDFFDEKSCYLEKFYNTLRIHEEEKINIRTFIFNLVLFVRKYFPYQSETKPQNFVIEYVEHKLGRKLNEEEIDMLSCISDLFKKYYKKESEDFYDWIVKNFVYEIRDGKFVYYERTNDPAFQYKIEERQIHLIHNLNTFSKLQDLKETMNELDREITKV